MIHGETVAVRDSIIGTMHGLRPDRPEGFPKNLRSRRGTGMFLGNERWHYFRNSESGEELYDIVSDPDETRNVVAENPQVASRLRDQISRELERRNIASAEVSDR